MARKKRPIHGNIARLREARGLTLTQFAARLKIDKSRVWHWENGDSAPSGRILPAVATELGVTIDELLREAA